ncbi:MAG: hypothetical protein ACFE89_05120 [Candidatus Hodarchaeota archaeon]
MTRFKYYTIYRCKHCGERIRVHGKLTSKLVLPSGITICCNRPRLVRERAILIDEYEKEEKQLQDESKTPVLTKQKSLAEYSKSK